MMSTAIFSFLGIIVGASLQYFFTRHLDNQKHLRELRAKAYIDYLNCVSELTHSGKRSSELLTKLTDTKARICLYGSPSTVSAFATFEKFGATIKSPEQCMAFTSMIASMRND